MSEEAWLSCEDPRKLLVWLRPAATDRRLRLFACAFWRWQTQRRAERTGEADREMNRALDYAELWAEEGAPPREGPELPLAFRWHPLLARHAFDAEWTIRGSPTCGRDWVGPAEQAQQVALLREVFHNPFRRLAFNPAWRTDAVLSLARQCYSSRDFAPLPILGDALQDAGCENADVVDHSRSSGPQVRGCWVVDLVLAKG
jgi:hypothetical protein